jgi:hypothetical protein
MKTRLRDSPGARDGLSLRFCVLAFHLICFRIELPSRFRPVLVGEHEELWGSRRRTLEFNVDVICRHPTIPHAPRAGRPPGGLRRGRSR